MSTINQKQGLRPAGKRSMMKLPKDRELRTRLTSAQCPKCGQRGARLSKVTPGWFACSWCPHTWDPEAPAPASASWGSCFVYSDYGPMVCPLCGVTVPVSTEHRCELKP